MSIWSKSQFACWQSHASQKPMQLGSPNLTQLGSRTQRSRSWGTKIVPTWFWHSCGRWLFLVGFYVHHVYSSFLCHVNAPRTSVFGICNMIWCGLITDVDQDRPTPLQVATSVYAHALTITYSPPKREIKRSCYPSDFNLYPTCVWRPLKLGLRPSLWLLFHRSFLITFLVVSVLRNCQYDATFDDHDATSDHAAVADAIMVNASLVLSAKNKSPLEAYKVPRTITSLVPGVFWCTAVSFAWSCRQLKVRLHRMRLIELWCSALPHVMFRRFRRNTPQYAARRCAITQQNQTYISPAHYNTSFLPFRYVFTSLWREVLF